MLHKCLNWFPQCCSLSLKIIIENIYLNWILASKVNPKCQLISALVAKVEQKLPGNRLKLKKWLHPAHHPAPPPLPVLHPRQVMQHLWGNPGKSCHDDFKAFLGTCPHKQEYTRTQVYVCRREIDNFYDVSFEPRFVLYFPRHCGSLRNPISFGQTLGICCGSDLAGNPMPCHSIPHFPWCRMQQMSLGERTTCRNFVGQKLPRGGWRVRGSVTWNDGLNRLADAFPVVCGTVALQQQGKSTAQKSSFQK